MQPIEGFTPEMLWTALIVLVGVCGLYILYGKVKETYQKQQEMKRIKNDPGDKLANEISKKVLDKMEPRFTDIDRKLANDKALIDDHTQKIAIILAHDEQQKEANKALCYGMLAQLNHTLHNGNKEEIEAASKKFNEFLAENAAK